MTTKTIEERFVYIRPLGNGNSFPSGIHDNLSNEDLFLKK
jgi:hypothetical protein